MRRLFLDTETTGLDPLKAQMLTIGLVVEEDDVIVYEREWKVKQMPWSIIDRYAMEVNKINLEKHNELAFDEVVVLNDIISELRRLGLMNTIIYGHNICFDIGFLRAALDRYKLPYPFNYHFGDSMVLAIALRDAGIKNFTSMRLSDLCGNYGIQAAKFHSALDDTKASMLLYKRLLGELRPRVPTELLSTGCFIEED